MPNKTRKPAPKPVVLKVEPVEEPIVESVVEPIVEPAEEPKPMPVNKPVYMNVRALGWYNNGTLIDTPWMPGETRRVTRELYKRLKQDLPDNWETV